MHGVCCTVYLPDAAREKAHDAMRQVGRRGEEMSTLRAQSITWASENKARRAEVASLRRELDELKREHGAVVSSATMWEERSNKLQDELKLKAGPCVQRAFARTAHAASHRSRGPPASSGLPPRPRGKSPRRLKARRGCGNTPMPTRRRECCCAFDHAGRACNHVEALGREGRCRRLCGGGRGSAHVEGGGGEGEPRVAP